MLSSHELRGNITPLLNGSRRVVRAGRDGSPQEDSESDRFRKWYRANRSTRLAKQSAYGKANRENETKRCREWRAANPERAKKSYRVRAARVYLKKRAAVNFMAAIVGFALSMGGRP